MIASNHRERRTFALFLVASLTGAHATRASVNLELRPATQTVVIGDTVNLGLYAVSNSGVDEPVGRVRAIIAWNPSVLSFSGVVNNGPYAWSFSGLPDDAAADGLNNTTADGEILYEAFAQLGNPAQATPGGLLVATFQLTAIETSSVTSVDIVVQVGGTTTEVLDEVPPIGIDVTGNLVPALVSITCVTAVDCNDGNPCTDDTCVSQACVHTINDANNPNDGLFCNGLEDFCQGGVVVFAMPPPDCDDGFPCTTDGCDENLDTCTNVLDGGACLIANVCYLSLELNSANDCERCDPTIDPIMWSFRFAGDPCGSVTDNACDNPDTCDGAGLCQTNWEPDNLPCPDDANECTDDVCLSGVCAHPDKFAGTPCGSSLNNACTNPDTCDGVGVCQSNDEPDFLVCDDGLFCTTASICQGGSCTGTPDACPNAICDEQTDRCKAVDLLWSLPQQKVQVGDVVDLDLLAVSAVVGTMSFSGMTVVLLWDAAQLELIGLVDNGPYVWSQSKFPDDCNLDSANDPCTGLPANDGDALYFALGQFPPSPQAVATQQGLLVTTFQFRAIAPGQSSVQLAATFGQATASEVQDAETSGLNILRSLGPPSLVNVHECLSNTDCNDNLFCNGLETCVNNLCVVGAIPCPGQLCDEPTDSCVDCLSDADCDDGLFCTGTETCVGGVCDTTGDPCPGRICDESAGLCANCLSDSDCNDGQSCTTDLCVGGSCNLIPDDSFCDDGLFCTGSETCSSALGCVSAGNPCLEPGVCDEGSQMCGGCVAPQAWGTGSRYITITPPAGLEPVALFVGGDPGNGSISCVQGYVQIDGTIGPAMTFQLPQTWGTINVHGEGIRPTTTYQARTVCGTVNDPIHSAAQTATTWRFSDVDGNDSVDLDDVLLLLAAFGGGGDPAMLPRVDLSPCDPNGQVDLDDILSGLAAFGGQDTLCPPVCLPGACCFVAQPCRDDLLADACQALGGFARSEGTSCDQGACRDIPAISTIGALIMALMILFVALGLIRRRGELKNAP